MRKKNSLKKVASVNFYSLKRLYSVYVFMNDYAMKHWKVNIAERIKKEKMSPARISSHTFRKGRCAKKFTEESRFSQFFYM
jgi:hypothetical protein